MGRRGRNRPALPEAPRSRVARLRERGDDEASGRGRRSEKPGSVTKGPAITVTCECGERRELFYGERWTCEACGRAYDTGNIPADEYAAIRALQRRFRALPIALGSVVALAAIVFTLTGNIVGVFFLMPVGIITWFVFIRPTHRRRYREAIAALPRWDLRADGPVP